MVNLAIFVTRVFVVCAMIV